MKTLNLCELHWITSKTKRKACYLQKFNSVSPFYKIILSINKITSKAKRKACYLQKSNSKSSFYKIILLINKNTSHHRKYTVNTSRPSLNSFIKSIMLVIQLTTFLQKIYFDQNLAYMRNKKLIWLNYAQKNCQIDVHLYRDWCSLRLKLSKSKYLVKFLGKRGRVA